jgi:Methyltransferase domain
MASDGQLPGAAAAWDREYAVGRYQDEPPLPFVADILAAAAEQDLLGTPGLYIGCGNGRNYLPLVAGGLELVGIDISATAIAQLAERAPERRKYLVCGDLTALPSGVTYSLVIGIQVFQHGDRARSHEHMRAAQARLVPGGLFCVRVNAVDTDLEYAHDVVEREADGGFTVRYRDGPKRGLDIHFFGGAELNALFNGYEAVLAPRLGRTWRTPRTRGQWSQWEGIWRKPH